MTKYKFEVTSKIIEIIDDVSLEEAKKTIKRFVTGQLVDFRRNAKIKHIK